MAKMCQTTTSVEDDKDGNANFDSVFLSLTERSHNCSCFLSVKNLKTFVNLYIRRLNNLTGQSLCGMEIEIYQRRRQEFILLNRTPTRCDSKETTISLSLIRNEYIQFTSRVVDGNFSSGYCIQISREHREGDEDDSFLEISCDGPAVTTPLDTLTQHRTTLNDVTTTVHVTPMLSSTTTMTDELPIHDKTDSEGDSTLYIALGTAGGFIICVSILVVILCKRQLSIKEADQGDNRNMQYDSLSESRNTLNYTTLNRTSPDMDDQQYEIVNSNFI
ncbi:uncharacterized protein LOC127725339 isoform X2 [Mytilus californianus]|uniref:uncharacterized protein LOC127725339 isoform X2 n=1 Tax=Mytilus californianus TaxID=6549 RepID=UPI002245B930|nr:uncharacterized protein LOC127725339 isoform X2 [Mytilus californianus]